MRWVIITAGVVLPGILGGCGKPDLVKGRLSPGTEARVYDDPKYPNPYGHLIVEVPKGEGFHGTDHANLAFDVSVEILEDDGEESDPKRLVRVRIAEGENKGVTAMVERWSLRPYPRK